jgi:hypothetical protein
METTVDLLQIKMDKAKAELPEESRRAIEAIDWKKAILELRTEKGYSFTQLESMELETELLLCGLLNPADYPKELETRMAISKPQVNELVNEMNEKVFKRIREELVKIIERKRVYKSEKTEETKEIPVVDTENIAESREELLKKIEYPEFIDKKEVPKEVPIEMPKETPMKPVDIYAEKTPSVSILEKKLSGSFQIPTVETEHTLNNISKDADFSTKSKVGIPNVDPYREMPQ